MKEKVLTVYVTLPSEHKKDQGVRQLAFKIPEDISQMELLKQGWAIDGKSALCAVSGYLDDKGDYITMTQALRKKQMGLIDWLATKGYEVEFR